MNISDLLHRALKLEWLTPEEGVFLFENASTAELMHVGDAMRRHHVPGNTVTWIIDRNSNTTNVCIANCKFCNFYRRPGHEESYITTIEEYRQKIDETFQLGGEQLLLQGGHHPDLGLRFYADLFRQLKDIYPNLKLHALGPPEIAHVAKLVPNGDIAANDYNIAVSSYVEAEDTREVIDITELNAQIARIVARQAELRTSIDAIVADLEGSDA